MGAINSIHNQGEGKIYIFEKLNEKYISTSSPFGGSSTYQKIYWGMRTTRDALGPIPPHFKESFLC
jgi:hypothetical protein